MPHVASHSDPLEVHLLGVVDYESALFLQERLVYDISGANDRRGTLLVCEHPPMVTIGREGSRASLLGEDREYVARQMPIRWTNRGGGCLVHCPGQLAIYPIVPLDRLGIWPSEYAGRLTDAVIDLCSELRVPAWPTEQGSGVSCRLGQFAYVGAAIKSDVTYHGMFVNVTPAMDFVRLVETSPGAERQTSLSAQRGRATGMNTVREGLVRHLAAGLGYERFHLHTGHPLFKRGMRKVPLSA